MSEELSFTKLTGFQRDLLLTISRLENKFSEEEQDLEIKNALEEQYGSVHYGRFFPNLSTLKQRDFVEKNEEGCYTITSRGKRAMKEHKRFYETALV